MKHRNPNFQPVIIVGAARSGTNMLRDMLTQLSGVSTWPCDEINYIWRHGNAIVTHDEFTTEHARPSVRRYIRRAFEKQARQRGCQFLVEKTCANSLRVGFVDAVVPEAKYVFLVRDGRDVVASARQRWTSSLDVGYVVKKARFVPPSDLAWYAARYFMSRVHRVFSSQKRLATWGPRFIGMHEMLAARTLEEVCAAQWAKSVESAAAAFGRIGSGQVIQLKYESLVQQPERELIKTLEFLGIDVPLIQVRKSASVVSSRSVGNWQRTLSRDAVDRISPIVQPQLVTFGYKTDENIRRRAA